MRHPTDELVWYAAYGSNLHWPRFRCYLAGGRPAGSDRVHRPCADPRPPRATAPATLPFPLRFAGVSPTWGGGIAFLDVRRRDAATRACLYLITRDQFATVVAAEGHRRSVRLPARASAAPPTYRVAAGAYGVVVGCGQRHGTPVLSVTGPPTGAATAAPRPAYLRMIAAGLARTHGMAPGAVAAYLAPTPGIAGHYGHDELLALARGRPSPAR